MMKIFKNMYAVVAFVIALSQSGFVLADGETICCVTPTSGFPSTIPGQSNSGGITGIPPGTPLINQSMSPAAMAQQAAAAAAAQKQKCDTITSIINTDVNECKSQAALAGALSKNNCYHVEATGYGGAIGTFNYYVAYKGVFVTYGITSGPISYNTYDKCVALADAYVTDTKNSCGTQGERSKEQQQCPVN